MADWQDAGRDGALKGGTMGSAFGPWGAAIGAVGGGLSGALSTSKNKYLHGASVVLDPLGLFQTKKIELDPNTGLLPNASEAVGISRGGMREAHDRKAPVAQRTQIGQVANGSAAQIDPRMQDQYRQRELALADRLSGIMDGTQQGAGELAAQRQGNRAIAEQQAFARMGRGTNAALAARSAARSSADIGLNTAGQAQQAAIQDQQMAAGQLGGVLAQGRATDVNMASQNAQLKQQMAVSNLDARNQQIFQQAGLDQATNLADMQAKLSTMGMNDAAQEAYLAQLFNVSQAEMQGGIEREKLVQGVGDAQRKQEGGLMSGAGSAIGSLFSDRRVKKNVRPASDVDSMLERLKSYEYEYKDPDKPLRGRGRHISVMAQDLEKSELGREMVHDTPEGKVVNYGKGLGTMLAAIARVHERVSDLEGSAKSVSDAEQKTAIRPAKDVAAMIVRIERGLGGDRDDEDQGEQRDEDLAPVSKGWNEFRAVAERTIDQLKAKRAKQHAAGTKGGRLAAREIDRQIRQIQRSVEKGRIRAA